VNVCVFYKKVHELVLSRINTSLFTYSKWNFDGPGGSAYLATHLNCHFCSNRHYAFGIEILGHYHLSWD